MPKFKPISIRNPMKRIRLFQWSQKVGIRDYLVTDGSHINLRLHEI